MPEFDPNYIYTPSSTIEFYHQGTFNPDESLNEYIQSVSYWVAPVLAVGIILCLWLVIWSCCMACNCGCCAKPMECSRSEGCERFGVLLMIALSIAIAGLLVWGWSLNDDISDTIGAVNSVFEVMENWSGQVLVAIAGVEAPAQLVQSGLTNLTDFATTGVDDCQGTGTTYSFDSADLNTISTDIDDTLAEMDTIEVDVADVQADIIDMKNTVNDLIEPINEERYEYTKYVLIGLGVLCGLQALVAICNSRCSQGAKPAQNCSCCTPLLTWLFIFVTFLLWTCAAIILTSTIGLSDFCMAPTEPVERLANFGGGSVNITFYMSCNELSEAQQSSQNPLYEFIDEAETYIGQATNFSNDLFVELAGYHTDMTNSYNTGNCDTTTSATCTCIEDGLNTLSLVNSTTEDIVENVQNVLTALTDPVSGVSASVSCQSLNSIYQHVLGVMCNDIADPMANFFACLLSLAVCMTALEFCRRIYRPEGLFHDQEFDEDYKGQTIRGRLATSFRGRAGHGKQRKSVDIESPVEMQNYGRRNYIGASVDHVAMHTPDVGKGRYSNYSNRSSDPPNYVHPPTEL